MPATTATVFVPVFAGQLVNPNGPAKAMPSIRWREIGNRLYDLTKGYHHTIIFGDIAALLAEYRITPVQEDGSPWEGFFTGAEGRASIQLAFEQTDAGAILAGGVSKDGHVLLRKALQLSWYKMESGRYEVVAYIG